MAKNVMVFDTETTGVGEKPFCYNVGYVILDLETKERFVEKDFVVEQIWHNIPLFCSAYYADKRPIYVSAMRGKRTIMDKWGYIMREMMNDIRKYNVEAVYAYNSPFDDRVFTFNNDWFHTNNPLDNVPVIDIRGMVSAFISNTEEYKTFCEEYQLLTESGNYSATAENVYRFITNDTDFIEAHTALADSQIEAEILLECIKLGADPMKNYPVSRFIPRNVEKPLKIVVDGETIFDGGYVKKWNKEGYWRFTTAEGMEE